MSTRMSSREVLQAIYMCKSVLLSLLFLLVGFFRGLVSGKRSPFWGYLGWKEVFSSLLGGTSTRVGTESLIGRAPRHPPKARKLVGGPAVMSKDDSGTVSTPVGRKDWFLDVGSVVLPPREVTPTWVNPLYWGLSS